MLMPNRSLVVLGAALLLGGCKEYFTVNEACADGLVGGNTLSSLEEEAMLRINCYRRLAGITKASANPNVQEAARGTIGYFQQNPSVGELRGTLGAAAWLQQAEGDPGFTGANIFERLTGDPIDGGAGYAISNFGGTGIWEFIRLEVASSMEELTSGKEAVDDLMRFPEFRQIALQPSYLDGGYAVGDVPSDWFVQGGWFAGDANADPAQAPVGRVHYMVVLYDAPHYEHVDTPVLMPKPDQSGVPLYSWSTNRNVVLEDGQYAPTQLSYPITLGMGSLNPDNFNEVDQNQYSAYITALEIVGPDGPVPAHVVHPGDDPLDSWPSGDFLRTTLAIYARRPFAADTDYQVRADLTTPEGEFRVDYAFHTAAEDPGVDPQVGVSPTTAGRTDRRIHLEPGVLHHPPASWPPASRPPGSLTGP